MGVDCDMNKYFYVLEDIQYKGESKVTTAITHKRDAM